MNSFFKLICLALLCIQINCIAGKSIEVQSISDDASDASNTNEANQRTDNTPNLPNQATSNSDVMPIKSSNAEQSQSASSVDDSSVSGDKQADGWKGRLQEVYTKKQEKLARRKEKLAAKSEESDEPKGKMKACKYNPKIHYCANANKQTKSNAIVKDGGVVDGGVVDGDILVNSDY